MRTPILCALFLSLFLTIASCASQDEFPHGEFFVPYDGEGHGLAAGDGAYFRFHEDGSFVVTDTAGIERITGTYAIDGDRFTETSSDLATCQPVGPAPYRWKYRDGILTFNVIGEDECVYRLELMDGMPFVKQ
jgi:hypothetical protein